MNVYTKWSFVIASNFVVLLCVLILFSIDNEGYINKMNDICIEHKNHSLCRVISIDFRLEKTPITWLNCTIQLDINNTRYIMAPSQTYWAEQDGTYTSLEYTMMIYQDIHVGNYIDCFISTKHTALTIRQINIIQSYIQSTTTYVKIQIYLVIFCIIVIVLLVLFGGILYGYEMLSEISSKNVVLV